MLNKCQLRTIYQMITEQGLLYTHKVQTTMTPISIYEMYNTNNKNTRTTNTLRPKYTPKTILLKISLFFKFTEIYATLPDQIKTITEIRYIKFSIKDHVTENYDPYTIPQLNKDNNKSDDD